MVHGVWKSMLINHIHIILCVSVVFMANKNRLHAQFYLIHIYTCIYIYITNLARYGTVISSDTYGNMRSFNICSKIIYAMYK